jgi:hypothetical protein
MSGNIDETKPQRAAAGCGKFEMGKSNVNRDAASFLFFQAVCVDPSQSLYERGFAVIDMSSSADDNGLHASSIDAESCGVVRRTLLSVAFDFAFVLNLISSMPTPHAEFFAEFTCEKFIEMRQ